MDIINFGMGNVPHPCMIVCKVYGFDDTLSCFFFFFFFFFCVCSLHKLRQKKEKMQEKTVVKGFASWFILKSNMVFNQGVCLYKSRIIRHQRDGLEMNESYFINHVDPPKKIVLLSR